MAAPKKTVSPAVKPAESLKPATAKTETDKPVVKSEPVKAETVQAAPVEAKAGKAEVSKADAPKTAAKPGRKPRGTAAKSTAVRKTVKKADQKIAVHVQFAGKSYSQEDLIKMAQDVWKYDLKQKVRELATVDLYVKPEENKVYYVMNQEFTGDFNI